MSSLQKTGKSYRLQFRVGNRGVTLSLGQIKKSEAGDVKHHVDRLLRVYRGTAELNASDRAWIDACAEGVRSRLEEIGLVDTVASHESPALMDCMDNYMAGRTAWKESTARSWETSRNRLFGFFARRTADSVTHGDIADCMEYLKGTRKLSENTARKTMAHLRQVFRWLVDHGIVRSNPCSRIKTTVGTARHRAYVPAEDAIALLPFCPHNEWRALIVLSRLAGLRCPSEAFQLRWSDINWETNRFTVHSPKTEHIPGHASRVVPLFPELRSYLTQYFEDAPAGQEYVCQNLRVKSGNIYAPFRKIIAKANAKPWARPWHNMRSSCETDLAGRFPVYLVGVWLGNSAIVAAKHYLQVTEEHFEMAVARTENVVAATSTE